MDPIYKPLQGVPNPLGGPLPTIDENSEFDSNSQSLIKQRDSLIDTRSSLTARVEDINRQIEVLDEKISKNLESTISESLISEEISIKRFPKVGNLIIGSGNFGNFNFPGADRVTLLPVSNGSANSITSTIPASKKEARLKRKLSKKHKLYSAKKHQQASNFKDNKAIVKNNGLVICNSKLGAATANKLIEEQNVALKKKDIEIHRLTMMMEELQSAFGSVGSSQAQNPNEPKMQNSCRKASIGTSLGDEKPQT